MVAQSSQRSSVGNGRTRSTQHIAKEAFDAVHPLQRSTERKRERKESIKTNNCTAPTTITTTLAKQRHISNSEDHHSLSVDMFPKESGSVAKGAFQQMGLSDGGRESVCSVRSLKILSFVVLFNYTTIQFTVSRLCDNYPNHVIHRNNNNNNSLNEER